MNNEFDQIKDQNEDWEEQKKIDEGNLPIEKQEAEEYPIQDEENPSKSSPRKIKKSKNIGISFLTAIAAAVVFVAAVVMPPKTSVSCEFIRIFAKKNQIDYTVNVAETSTDLMLVVTNGVVEYTVPLVEGENVGSVEGLVPDMNYTVAVVGNFGFGNTTVIKEQTRTATTETYWEALTHECKCYVDGYFHFLMEFVDENGWYKDFEARLTDADGSVSTCVFSSNLHEEQFIDVINTLVGDEAHFYLACTYAEPGAEKQMILFDGMVKI